MLTTKQPISRTRAPAKSKRPSAKSAPAADVTHESIARRAYELYISRGPHEGDALADWFRAERELSATASSA